jgi:hypothetical protein
MEPIDLRDKFACSLAAGWSINDFNHPGMSGKVIVAMAYTIADRMLEARGMTKEKMIEWALEGKDDVL